MECASVALRESILRAAPSLGKEKITIETASDCISVIVCHVPLYIRTPDNRIKVTKELVVKECQSVFGVITIQVCPNKVKEDQYTTNWIVHFEPKLTNLNFRHFNESGPTMPFVHQRAIEECQRCWGFHATRTCTKGNRCGQYTNGHEKTECSNKVPKCLTAQGLTSRPASTKLVDPEEKIDQWCHILQHSFE